jgi:hypothetical protein
LIACEISMKNPDKDSIQELFIYAIILKIGATLLGWWVGDRWILSFVVPLLIMAAYVWGGLRWRKKDEVSDEKFADSCYYLGFIFTISSIIVSLFDLPSLLTGGKLEDIAVRFGAAMISTVIGLIVRVSLVSFRKDIGDVTRAIEEDLLEAEKAFRAQLGAAVDRLREFNAAVDDSAHKVVSRLEASIEETAKANTAEFTRLFDGVGRLIGESSQRSLQSLDASAADLRKSLQLYATSLVTTAKHHETKLNLFSENMTGKIDTFSYAIGASLTGLTQRIDEFSAALNKNLHSMSFPAQMFTDELNPAITALRNSLAGVVGQVSGFAVNLESEAGRIATALHAVPDSVAVATENIRKAVEQQSKTIDKVNAQEDALLKLAHNVKYFEIALERAMSVLDEQRKAIADLATAVVAVSTDHQVLQNVASGQTSAAQQLAEQMARLAQAMERFAPTVAGQRSTNG